jgi:hypothetical protein
MLVLIVAAATFAQEVAQPGPEHARLKELEGNWDAVVKLADSQAAATSVSRMGPGGLWLVTDFKGELGGSPFTGHGIDGYDQDRKKYVGVWVDSMTSSIMTFEGTYDEGTKTLTTTGHGKGPDGSPATYKTKTRIKDKDHHTFEMFLAGQDGTDHLMMTIEYSRRK